MQNFTIENIDLDGPMLIQVFCAEDERGYLLKDYSKSVFEKNGIDYELKEVFYTSSKRNVIRAIHFQRIIQQPKLIRVVKGKVFDVIVDLRAGSPTMGQWRGFYLSEDSKMELLIPGGFGHGYLVLEDSIVSYKCSEPFVGEYDDGIMWNDEDIAVEWPLDQITGELIMAEKDRNLQSFYEFKKNYGGLK
ncbi:MAG: dTDP-4-dehydrorhamnose 3,5-epimerase [Lachnospiraceae bacterium]|nr:dTDP-4-dehydrorhamnose 3,5-epimerase [Lachnospiraceae bacterium]